MHNHKVHLIHSFTASFNVFLDPFHGNVWNVLQMEYTQYDQCMPTWSIMELASQRKFGMRVILTKDNLVRTNWRGNKDYSFCKFLETIQHLFSAVHMPSFFGERYIWCLEYLNQLILMIHLITPLPPGCWFNKHNLQLLIIDCGIGIMLVIVDNKKWNSLWQM